MRMFQQQAVAMVALDAWWGRWVLVGMVLLSVGCGKIPAEQPLDIVEGSTAMGIAITPNVANPASADVRVTPTAVLPTMPEQVTVTQTHAAEMMVNWNTVATAQSYRVYAAMVRVGQPVKWVKYVADAPPFELSESLFSDVLEVYIAVSGASLAGEGPLSAPVAMNTSRATATAKSLTTRLAQDSPIKALTPTEDAVAVPLNVELTVEYVSNSRLLAVWVSLMGPRTLIFGEQRNGDDTVIFIPSRLEAGTDYIATVTFFEINPNGTLVTADYRWSFTTHATEGTVAPNAALVLLGSEPAQDALDVSTTVRPKFMFSEPIDIVSVENGGIQLLGVAGIVAGRWRSDKNDIKFRPDSPLATSMQYTVLVSTGVMSVDGDALTAEVSWSFTTAVPDTTPPSYVSATPAEDESNVSVNQRIKMTFSEPIDQDSVTEGGVQIFAPDNTLLPGKWRFDDEEISFKPTLSLQAGNKEYQVFVNSTVTDMAKNPLGSNVNWRFFTENPSSSVTTPTPSPTVTDLTPPTYVKASPRENETNVSIKARIKMTFSEPIRGDTLSTDILVLDPMDQVVEGTWRADEKKVVFRPAAVLQSGDARYQVIVNPTVRDLADNPLGTTISWDFFTEILSSTPTPTASDIVPPTYVSASPSENETNVSIKKRIKITFSEPIANISLPLGITIHGPNSGVLVPGTWDTDDDDAEFRPAVPLQSGNAQYQVTVNPSVTDLADNPLGVSLNWRFFTEGTTPLPTPTSTPVPTPIPVITPIPTATPTPTPTTGITLDTTAPFFVRATPANNATNVAVTTQIRITFSEPVNQAFLTFGITVHHSDGSVLLGQWVSEQNNAVFTPTSPLQGGNAQYRVFINPLVADLAGNPLGRTVELTFFTATTSGGIVVGGSSADTIPPMLMQTFPTIGEQNIAVNSSIRLVFSEPVILSSVQNDGVRLQSPAGAWLSGAWTSDGNEIVFTPATPLQGRGAQHWVFVNPTVTDFGGNLFGENFNWGFFTQ